MGGIEKPVRKFSKPALSRPNSFPYSCPPNEAKIQETLFNAQGMERRLWMLEAGFLDHHRISTAKRMQDLEVKNAPTTGSSAATVPIPKTLENTRSRTAATSWWHKSLRYKQGESHFGDLLLGWFWTISVSLLLLESCDHIWHGQRGTERHGEFQ